MSVIMLRVEGLGPMLSVSFSANLSRAVTSLFLKPGMSHSPALTTGFDDILSRKAS